VLGNREDDDCGRRTEDCESVQVEATRQGQAAHRAGIFARGLELGGCELYEYAVLVTSLPDEILALGQHYRDRAVAENNFDELKNQWGWSVFTTHDLKRCQIMARIIALVYNWWSLFTRLAIPEKHAEAITSRPPLLNAVGKQTTHGGQTTVTVTSMHAKAPQMRLALQAISGFLATVRNAAEPFLG
jgi:hypothetical protein